jgi:vacuolar-type H+-ATPase subunit H
MLTEGSLPLLPEASFEVDRTYRASDVDRYVQAVVETLTELHDRLRETMDRARLAEGAVPANGAAKPPASAEEDAELAIGRAILRAQEAAKNAVASAERRSAEIEADAAVRAERLADQVLVRAHAIAEQQAAEVMAEATARAERQAGEVLVRSRATAEQQAAEILAEARARADRLLVRARRESLELVEAARQEVASLYASAAEEIASQGPEPDASLAEHSASGEMREQGDLVSGLPAMVAVLRACGPFTGHPIAADSALGAEPGPSMAEGNQSAPVAEPSTTRKRQTRSGTGRPGAKARSSDSRRSMLAPAATADDFDVRLTPESEAENSVDAELTPAKKPRPARTAGPAQDVASAAASAPKPSTRSTARRRDQPGRVADPARTA